MYITVINVNCLVIIGVKKDYSAALHIINVSIG